MWTGEARQGTARQAWFGLSRHVRVRRGMVWQARRARLGEVRRVMVWQARLGKVS